MTKHSSRKHQYTTADIINALRRVTQRESAYFRPDGRISTAAQATHTKPSSK